MTIRDAISRVKSSLKLVTGDAIITNRHIYSILSTSLGVLIERNKDKVYKSDMYTTERLIPERVMLSEFTCVPLDCEVCRVKLTNPMYTKDGVVVRWVGPENVTEGTKSPFRVVTPSQYSNKVKLNPFGKYSFIEDGYLYLQECIPCVKVVYLQTSPNLSGCGILDMEFSVPEFLQDAVFKMTFQELSIYLQRPLDITQNKNPNA